MNMSHNILAMWLHACVTGSAEPSTFAQKLYYMRMYIATLHVHTYNYNLV